MTTRIWTKPQTQAALRALRVAKYNVHKHNNAYAVSDDEGVIVFRAMGGTRGYLVTHRDGLFEYKKDAPRVAAEV